MLDTRAVAEDIQAAIDRTHSQDAAELVPLPRPAHTAYTATLTFRL